MIPRLMEEKFRLITSYLPKCRNSRQKQGWKVPQRLTEAISQSQLPDLQQPVMKPMAMSQ